MGQYVLAIVTIDDPEKAAQIAHKLVELKLVACVNIVPEIRSVYFWQNQIYDEREVLMLMKTRKELFEALQNQIRNLHPYEVPEIIAFDIAQGLPEYLKWIDDSTNSL